MLREFKLNEVVTHRILGRGVVTKITERTMKEDWTNESLIEVTFDNMVRETFWEGKVYTVRFNQSSLASFLE